MDDGHDGGKTDCADSRVRCGVVGDGVQVLGANQAVEALDEGVVEQKHETGKVPCPTLVPEEHLANVANVLDLGVTKAEFPEEN